MVEIHIWSTRMVRWQCGGIGSIMVIIETHPNAVPYEMVHVYFYYQFQRDVPFRELHPKRDRERCNSVQHQDCSVLSRLREILEEACPE